jgi:N-acetylneuraminic acid mutarotase
MRRLADLPVALSNAAAAVLGRTVYVAGGENADKVSGAMYAMDLDADEPRWDLAAELQKPLSHAVLIGCGRGLWLAGGRKRNPGGMSDLSDAVYRWDTVARRWSPCRALPYALSAGAGVLLDENRLLLIGGDKGDVFHQVEKLIEEIARTSDPVRRQELVLQKARVQSSHPGFSKDILLYDMLRDEWRVYGELPFPAPATTTAVRWGDDIVIPGGEIRAGVRTPQILVGTINR